MGRGGELGKEKCVYEWHGLERGDCWEPDGGLRCQNTADARKPGVFTKLEPFLSWV